MQVLWKQEFSLKVNDIQQLTFYFVTCLYNTFLKHIETLYFALSGLKWRSLQHKI